MNLELKIEAPQSKPVVFNYLELKEGLTTALADYKNRIYTEDMIGEAKADKAKLNKLRKTLSDERIARKKDFMKPFETFENQVKELCEIIDTASSGIGEQLEAFEQKRVDEKTARIKSMFDEIISIYPINFLTLDKIFDDSWLNKTTSEKTISADIALKCEKIVNDLDIIKKLSKHPYEAEHAYKECLDLNKALDEGERIAEIQAEKGQETQAIAETENACEMTFKCKITKTQAQALVDFCKANGIKLERV